MYTTLEKQYFNFEMTFKLLNQVPFQLKNKKLLLNMSKNKMVNVSFSFEGLLGKQNRFTSSLLACETEKFEYYIYQSNQMKLNLVTAFQKLFSTN